MPTRPASRRRRRRRARRDGFRAEERDAGQRPRPRLVGRDDRPRQGVRHRPLLRRQLEPARRLPRHDGPVVDEPGDGPALRVRLSGHHRRRHGAGASARSSMSSGSRGWPPSPAARSAACRRSSGPSLLRRSGRRDHPHREHARAAAAGRRLERDRAQRHHGRSRLAGRPLLRHRTRADRGHGRGAHGRTHHVPLGRRRSTTSSAGGCSSPTTSATRSRSPSSRSRATCATRRTRFVKRFDANTYLYTSRALSYFDLARQYGGGRLAHALRNVSARTLLIAFSSDWLYPPSGSEELAAALRAAGKEVELHVIDAPYGHDCFLLEEARQTPMIQAVPRALSGVR